MADADTNTSTQGDFGPATKPGSLRIAADALKMIPSNLGFWLGGRHKVDPPQPKRVPFGDFIGLNVATGPDESYDDYVASAVSELGISRVRIDFGDCPAAAGAPRITGKLAASGIEVTGHMVQDPALGAATSKAALASWRDFCNRTAGELKGDLSSMDAGSAPNRRGWSGHSVGGYLATAAAVFEAARDAGIEVWAPNVNDFEPYWALGILKALERRGLTPDRHSVNLFVDRAGTPEENDSHAWPFHPDMAGKARTMAAIGREAGVGSTVSTYCYWTLNTTERRRRRYVDEDRYADMMVRYLALAAASGCLDRAYWGTMISHAKGLIDDGTEWRPRPPAAHHNFLLRGSLDGYRKRPAFRALKAMVSRLCACTACPVERTGDIFTVPFRGPGEAWSLCWTTGAETTVPAELAAAAEDFQDIGGKAVPPDSARITGSPLFVRMPAGGEPGE